MKKLLLAGVAVLSLLNAAGAQEHQRVKYCHGEWTEMRVIGYSVGDCDINSIPEKKLQKIKELCGEPWRPSGDTDNSPNCWIKALVVPFKNRRGADVFKVLKVLEP